MGKCQTFMQDAVCQLYLLILWGSMDGGEKVETGELDTVRIQWKYLQHTL